MTIEIVHAKPVMSFMPHNISQITNKWRSDPGDCEEIVKIQSAKINVLCSWAMGDRRCLNVQVENVWEPLGRWNDRRLLWTNSLWKTKCQRTQTDLCSGWLSCCSSVAKEPSIVHEPEGRVYCTVCRGVSVDALTLIQVQPPTGEHKRSPIRNRMFSQWGEAGTWGRFHEYGLSF